MRARRAKITETRKVFILAILPRRRSLANSFWPARNRKKNQIKCGLRNIASLNSRSIPVQGRHILPPCFHDQAACMLRLAVLSQWGNVRYLAACMMQAPRIEWCEPMPRVSPTPFGL